MSNRPLISVILCTWNSEKTISETILSLYNQTFKNFEIIVVDKNSCDNTLNIINNYFRSVKIIQQSKSGIYNAFNLGIDAAIGELVFILNSDDFLSPNAFNEVNLYYKSSNFDVAFLPIYSSGGFKKNNVFSKLFLGCDYCFIGHSASFFIKKSIHSKYGNYNEAIKHCADYEFYLRLIDYGIEFNVIDTLSFGIFRPGGFSSVGNYLEKRVEEFQFRFRRIKLNYSDLLYCFIIFPIQFLWSFIRKIKL